MNNAQTWIEINKETIGTLDDLQYDFLRILLASPASTPRAALLWDCGMVKMKFCIMQMKLTFLNYMLMQGEDSLAHRVVMKQKKMSTQALLKSVNK